MKITIELSQAEVLGIKAYLKEVDDVKATKVEIKQFVESLVQVMHAPQEAVSDYINQFEKRTI